MSELRRVLVERFEAAAARAPDDVAVAHHGRTLTYSELNAAANRLAHMLLGPWGVTPGEHVAIAADRGLELIVAVVGVLKAGAGYVPLDASYPPDRLTFMLEDSGARLLLVSAALAGQFAAFPGRTVTLEAMISEAAAQPAHDPDASIDGRAPGYVIYTSGSTGKPKGVVMSRGALDNLIGWQLRHTSVLAGGRTVQFSPLSFDVSFQEIASTLAAGGTLVLIDEAERLDSARLLTFLREQRIDRLFLPFVALQALSEQGAQAAEVPTTLKEVVTAGEQLQVTRSLVRFFERIAPATLHNHYGPSETHVVTSYELTGPPASWPRLPPIGAPIDGVRAYLADPEGRLVPDGEEGELYFGGVALADGYLGRPELTAERFLKNPFGAAGAGPGDDGGPGLDRVYRTGDLGRRLPDGNLEFLGRRDGQVKIRGFRVELGEIEVALDAHPGVAQVAVTARDDASGEGGPKRLVAYVVRKVGQTTNASALRRHLSERVPDYMLPSAFVFLQALPTTASGKIDRRALPAPTRARPELDQPYREPRTPIEREICALWSELLDIEPVGARDDFFDLGGTSLHAMRFASEFLRRTGRELPVVLLFEHSTPAALAESLERGSAADDYVASARARQRRASAGGAEAIAIVGMAGRFPDAVDVEALWRNLCEGREGVRFFAPDELDASVPRELRQDPAYVAARGVLDEVAGFDAPLFGIGPREADIIDPQQRMLLELAWHALEDAGCDPARVEGQVGVWAGVMNNTYFSENLRRRPDVVEAVGAFSVMTANEKDYVATRISHRLNLTGPSVSVHTACSTSLVAVHLAAQSLRAYECDAALAGGACITVPSASGYLYNEGGMLSADGHCRPFDAAATGTTFSDGAGMVVLRRLADAVRDGDRIYAVIRGSAINNDGGAKASFTAPSVEGQARAIAAAVAAADVPSDSIGYVETHGTATPLGDPIEVAALLRVYGRGSSEPTCGLGSIKSNFGHLTAAAGVTGLIKATLAVERGQIPPTLHFRSPNPAIDFGGRFFVVDQLRDWPDGTAPRRAAISSMGVGGTNAHAIIEQAPPAPPEETSRTSSRPSEVLWMSARTDGALDALGRALADHLERHPQVPLGDVAFTLAHGRRPLGRRRAVVARDHAALIAALRTGKGDVQTGAVPAEVPEVAFVFPGQGTQYPGMARGLFDSEPTFRAALQQCALVLEGQLAAPLLELLYPATADEAAADRLRETQHAQPALFAVEYALAQLFLSWGIRPAAMVGHSVGEFVAATLAGVFTLSDALRLVAARGRLMQQMPPGAMLSVRAPADVLASRLVPGTEIAAINGRSLCVAAGPVDAVAALEARLTAEEVPCKRLRTSHAFHTAMMEPVIAPFTELVRQIQLSAPRIPFVSTATGRWIGDDEATDPGYWARHLRAPVQFAPALQALCEGRSGIVLELGPSGTLPALLRQSLEAGQAADLRVVTALGPVSDATGEQVALMHAVGTLWTAGLGVDTRAFWMHERRRKVPLPLYPFERQRHWVDAPSDADAAPALPVAAPHAVRAAPGAPRAPSTTTPSPPPHVEDRDIAALAAGTPSAVPRPVPGPAPGPAPGPVPRPEVVMAHETHRSRVVQQVRALLEQASGFDLSTFDEKVTFPEMGVDSLLMTQAALTFKKKFGVPVSFRQLNEDLSSMGALADYLLPHVPMEAPPPSSRARWPPDRHWPPLARSRATSAPPREAAVSPRLSAC